MTRFFIKKPIFSFVIMILAVLIGVFSLINTPKKLMPELEMPVVSVISTYPGASSEEVLLKLTEPLEKSLGTINGLDQMESTSSESYSSINLIFNSDTNVSDVENDILSKINSVDKPENSSIQMYKFSTSDIPVIQLALMANETDVDYLKDIEDIKSEILKVEGVSSVDISKDSTRFIDINLDKDKLGDLGLTVSDVTNILSMNNFSMPGSMVEGNDDIELTTRFSNTINSFEEVKNIEIGVDEETGDKVTLKEISNIEMVHENENDITKMNDKEAVLLQVTQKSNANTAKLSEDIIGKIDNMIEGNYNNISYVTIFDQGEYTNESINNVAKNLIIGGILAIIIILLFLRSISSSIVISVAIPFSLLVTFIFLYYFELSLNVMTLGGLALSVGMLVDNSIVVIENIYRHIQMGKDRKKAAFDGTKEVASAIIASTLTTIAVFLPLTFSTGMVKTLFTEFAITVCVSLLSSLIVALTVIPTLSSIFIKDTNIKKTNKKGFNLFKIITKWALKRRVLTLVIVSVLFILGMTGIFRNGMELMPQVDQGVFTVSLKEDEKIDTHLVEDRINEVSNYLNSQEEVKDVFINYDKDEPLNVTMIGIMVDTQEREFNTEKYIKDFQSDLKDDIKDLTVNLNTIDTGTLGNSGELTFSIDNRDKEVLLEDLNKVVDVLEGLEETESVSTNISETKEEFVYRFDKSKLEENGLTAVGVASEINQSINKNLATTIRSDNGDIIDVYVKLDNNEMNTLDEINDYLIETPFGNKVRLGDISDVTVEETVSNIIRTNGVEKINISVKYDSDVDLGTFTSVVFTEVFELELDKNTNINIMGDLETLLESIVDILLVMVLAILLVYLVMVAQFESFKRPFIIMFTIPLISIGISIGINIANIPMSLIGMLGIVILVGIVVNNAIVFIDYANQLKLKGKDTREALLESIDSRTRPILMTALTTILGLIPLSLGIGEGAELQQPMGVVVIGGLVSSTFLTLVVIPVLYDLLDGKRNKSKVKKEKRK